MFAPIKPAAITAARETLGARWGLARPLTLGELGMLLRLAPASAWKTVTDWEEGRREPSGPVTVAIELMVGGADPAHLPEVLKPTRASTSPRGPRGHSAAFAEADLVLSQDGRVLKSRNGEA